MAGEQGKNYTPHQQKIIKRYYENQPLLSHQQLAELIGDLYLAEGKKKQTLWKRAAELMQRLKIPQARIDHLVKQGDPKMLAEVVKELEGKPA